MASKEEVIQTVREYVAKNNRNCPKSHLISTFGPDIVDIVAGLVRHNVLGSQRGRTGGLFVTEDKLNKTTGTNAVAAAAKPVTTTAVNSEKLADEAESRSLSENRDEEDSESEISF